MIMFVRGFKMSPAARDNTKWIVSITVSIIVIISFAFSLGVGFAGNEADHVSIKKDVVNVHTLSAAATENITAIKIELKGIGTTMSAQAKTLEKIEKKIP
jgi:hypothetical protein